LIGKLKISFIGLVPLISLCAFLALVIVIRQVQLIGVSFEELPVQAATLLSLAVLLIGAWLAGVIVESIHLPRICGYILFGILVGPSQYGLQILPTIEHVQYDLKFINFLAISLIAFIAGGEVKLKWLREQFKRFSTLTVTEACIIFIGSLVVVGFASPLLPFLSDNSIGDTWIIAALIALVISSNSPAVAIAMISDYKAKGPLAQTTLSMTISKDMIIIVMFAIIMAIAKSTLQGEGGFSVWFFVAVGLQLVGSIGIGAAVGLLMALYVQKVRAHFAIFIIACCMLFALVGEEYIHLADQKFHFEPLLMAIAAGVAMENLYPKTSRPLFERMEDLSLPVYCMFFALAGAKVDITSFLSVWYLCIGLFVIRILLIYFGVKLGCYLAGYKEQWAKYIWFGLVPQAGVSLVLVTLIAQSFTDFVWLDSVVALLIGVIVLDELLGPIGFRHALVKSGEATRGI